MKRGFIICLALIVTAAAGSLVFIREGNDHKECSTVKEYSIDKDGNKVVTQKHVCKEKYSF